MRGTLELADLVRVPTAVDGQPGLPALPPHRIGAQLPGLYAEDDFTQRFTSGLDPVLATVFVALDSLDAYLDPLLTPLDFLPWLAGWVGAELAAVSVERRRELVHEAAALYGAHGTAHGIARQVELRTGVRPDIEETGGAAASPVPGGAVAPGSPGAAMVVRLRVPDPSAVDVDELDQLIARAKPAHVVHRLEVVPG
jgi:phage tail-like protein